MHALVGLLVAAFGAALAVFGPAFAKGLRSGDGGPSDRGNAVAFRVIGGALVVMGLLYTIGVLG
ncbi:hypothetical protein ACFV19_28970 [Streptomyces griseoluteus]|uniref:hypothetical protein n=1 Tax=Streptomyces griseoluteus TaxID=29306 RepID=UPI0036C864B4